MCSRGLNSAPFNRSAVRLANETRSVVEARGRWQGTTRVLCLATPAPCEDELPPVLHRNAVHLPARERTIRELISTSTSDSQPSVTPIGEPTPTAIPVEIAARFQGIPLDFDFDAL